MTPNARVHPLITQTVTSLTADFKNFSTQLENIGSMDL